MLMINHSIFHKFFRRKNGIFHKKVQHRLGEFLWQPFARCLSCPTPSTAWLDKTAFDHLPTEILLNSTIYTLLFTPFHNHPILICLDKSDTQELMASGGQQPARVLGTCWPQLWPGHTAAGGKRATLVPSFPPLSLSLHLPPLLSEHQSKSRRIRPKRYFMGLEIYIG